MKMAEDPPKGLKTLWETSNFSLSRSVFKKQVLQTGKNQGLFGKGLNKINHSFSTGRVALQKRIMALLRKIDNSTPGTSQVSV